MIKYWITDSKTFNYNTDSDTAIDIKIDVYEYDEIIYNTELNIVKNVNYYTSLSSGWNDKKVVILNKNTQEILKFDIQGLNNNDNKYVKKLIFNDRTDLCDIMDRHRSDKASQIISSGHNYTRYYNYLFKDLRTKNINVFELGLGTNNENYLYNMGKDANPGASLFGWREYFKNANIYGADIDPGCLFNSDRIKTFFCDQTVPWIINQMWDNKYLDFKFDIIIDDGLHRFDANVSFFENSFHKLNKNGVFIIEDINNRNIVEWINKFEYYENRFPQFNFEIICLDCDHNRHDNNLIMIHYK